jgi:hypothetical protein
VNNLLLALAGRVILGFWVASELMTESVFVSWLLLALKQGLIFDERRRLSLVQGAPGYHARL